MKTRIRETAELSVGPAMLRRMGIPEIHFEAALSKIGDEGRTHRDAIKHYITNMREYVQRGVGLILHGMHGTGKTAIATILLRECRARKGDGLLMDASQVTETAFGELFDHETTLAEQARQVEILAIDDYGAEHWSPFGARQMEQLVRHRCANLKPLVLTTNLSLMEFAAKIGAPVMALLRAHTIPVKVEGIQWRAGRVSALLEEAKKMGLV